MPNEKPLKKKIYKIFKEILFNLKTIQNYMYNIYSQGDLQSLKRKEKKIIFQLISPPN